MDRDRTRPVEMAPSPVLSATRKFWMLLLLFLMSQISTGATTAANTRVYYITPTVGGLNGGQRLTIHGKGFADDQFSFGEGRNHVGNHVEFVSSTRSYVCDILEDGCTETQIMCYTRPMPEDDYYVRVWVDSAKVPDSNLCENEASSSKCRLRARYSYSPIIDEVSPRTGPPGTLVTLSGRLFTDLYTTSQEKASNGNSARITRVYMGGQACNLLNPDNNNEMYGIELKNDGTSPWGFLRCRINGTYVGNANASFLVNGYYGRTFSDLKTLQVTGQNKIGMFQSYAVITSVTPEEGSIEGGASLTIQGQGFDDAYQDAPAQVLVGGEPCNISSVAYDQIVCTTSPQPLDSKEGYSGGRGILEEMWNFTDTRGVTWEEISNATSQISNFTSPQETIWRDQMSWNIGPEPQSTIRRMRGYFVAPTDNVYRFAIKSDDDGILYGSLNGRPEDKVEIASCPKYSNNYWSVASQISSPFTLVKGHRVYLELLVKNHQSGTFGYVAVHMENTQFLGTQSNNVDQEAQEIITSSTQLTEKQWLGFENWSKQDPQQEVQRVDVESDQLGGVLFRLGMNGAFTGPMHGDASGDDIRKELNFLPSIAPDSVRVSEEAISGGNRYTITFVSQRGDWLDLEAINDPASPVNATFTVKEVQQGQSSMAVLVLGYNGHPSPPITAPPTRLQLADGLNEMFSVRCPSYITKAFGKAYFEDYESDNGYSESGNRVSDIVPFCGHTSSKNPGFIYTYGKKSPKVDPLKHKYLCFAYKGSLKSSLHLSYKYQNINSDQLHTAHDTFDRVEFPDNNRWNYVCVDIAALILGNKNRDVSSSSQAELQKVVVYRVNDDEDMFIDSVFMGNRKTTEDPEGFAMFGRLVPGSWDVDSVKVTDSSSGFMVEFNAINCANGTPLLSVHNMQPTTSTTDQAIYGGNIWPADVKLNITRIQASTSPVGGRFDLSFKGAEVKGIPADVESANLKDRLEEIPDVDFVRVSRKGNCGGYTWTVHWETSPGNQPQIQLLNSTNITGLDANIKVLTKVDGGVWFDPLPGDVVRTSHEKPQVEVIINNIPSRCSGNCSFQWTERSTPTVSSVTPTSGSSGTVLTVNGTGFPENVSQVNVTIGGTACQIISSTAMEIQCEAGPGPAGMWPILVMVQGKGFAKHTGGPHKFTYLIAVTAISPTGGSLAGGTQLTINGTGFASDMNVTIDGNSCEVKETFYDSMTCTTPSNSAGSYDVIVQKYGSTATSPSKFAYQSSLTPIITMLSGTSGLVQGGQVLTVNGSGFGSQMGQSEVQIGVNSAEISRYSDISIELTLPSAGPGHYPLNIYVENKGFADTSTNNISLIQYTLAVNKVVPSLGSLAGGTRVTILGEGFSPIEEDNQVLIGDIPCTVINSTQTKLHCDVESPSKTVIVTNHGLHPEFGVDYAWVPRVANIIVGDSVQWQWQAPSSVSGVGYLVQQVSSARATQYDGKGFSSGNSKTSDGVYQYQFTSPGTYHYWSDKVDSRGRVVMRGVVIVKPWQSFSSNVTVKVSGYEANYNSSDVATPADEACSSTNSTIPGCIEDEELNPDMTRFAFTFSNCSSPIVTTFTPKQGSNSDNITFLGTGFSDICCENEILIGGTPCIINSCSNTEISCRVDMADQLQIGVLHSVVVKVNNRGIALLDVEGKQDRSFVLLPSIKSVTPTSGSMRGQTKLTISGNGFQNDTKALSVSIGGIPCHVAEVSNTNLTCFTDQGSELTANISVAVISHGQAIPASCVGSCEFSFSSSSTPTVTQIDPPSVNTSNQVINISGSKFGSSTSDVESPLVGSQPLAVKVIPFGLADSVVSLTVEAVLTDVFPNRGSIYGGLLLTVEGIGFKHNATQVSIGNNECTIKDINATSLTCYTPAGSAAVVEVKVVSDQIIYPTLTFEYTDTATPDVSAVIPTSGISGEVITVTGSGFGTINSDVAVSIHSALCNVTAVNDTSITCILGEHATGSYGITVKISGKGLGPRGIMFSYELTLSSISPTTGSFGGGQLITLSGRGFEDKTNVTICGDPCDIQSGTTSTQLVCSTPPHSGSGSQTCDVIAALGGSTATLGAAYTYSDSITARLTGVSPKRGGTGGGTSLTISGSGFGTNSAQVSVDIAGTNCPVNSVMDTQIICTTDEHRPSEKTQVRVQVASNGIAAQIDAEFEYIDVWSSPFTWNGTLPQAGDLVVIPADMTVLLDTNTPIMKLLLIKGGKLIFDERNVELQSEIILITDGGHLQIGTEEAPFQHKAVITLHGHHRSKELPIYGTKTIAVREGTLELHGKHVGYTWTKLESTANAGATQITLQDPVSWQIGDEIVIATTGHRHTQSQNEKRNITSITNGGKTLTLNRPLTYKHLGETLSIGGHYSLEARAEVGLLTRNVVVRGSIHTEWTEKIENCPDGFDTGEFAVQTCFQGRFGEEIGSDQFGAQIIMHAQDGNKNLVTAHFENVELTHVGQAFRLGRYPIHYHLLGNMYGSYIKSCSIHRSFNRAIVIHGTHNVLVENNIVYDIMGGAVFLEDGIETGNVLQYNLAVFVKQSTSLQNDDITPAAYWVTNPNNTIQHNTAVGGTHFGFWYRMHHNPDGPSFDKDICPRKVPLGVFKNNTVHSHGWFGIWIFQHYYPMKGGSCSSNEPEPAHFYSLTAWNCEKGAEWVGGGALQFIDFNMINNDKAGIEMKLIANAKEYSPVKGAMISGGVIAARPDILNILDSQNTKTGIILPYSRGLIVRNVTFINFNFNRGAAFGVTDITGTSEENNGGFTYHTSGLTFINATNKVGFRWEHEAVFYDIDGSLGGVLEGKIVACTATLPPSCLQRAELSANIPGCVCPSSIDFHRWSFNNFKPFSLLGRRLAITNQYGTSFGEYKKKRITHRKGWMVLLPSKDSISSNFVNAEHLTNISYSGRMDDFQDDSYLIWALNVTQKPDMVTIYSGQPKKNESSTEILSGIGDHGDWFYENSTTTIHILLKRSRSSRTRRSVGDVSQLSLNLKIYRCYYQNCLPPPPPVDPGTIPPPNRRPADFKRWSDIDTWSTAEPDWGGNYGNGQYGPPKDWTDVMIMPGDWVVVDVSLPVINKLYIYGVLELEYQINPETGDYYDFTLNCSHILISGGRLIVGWEDAPFLGQANIVLRGDHYTPDMPLPDGPNMGAKALGVFGGLDLHGKNREVTWTQLARTAEVGQTRIVLATVVDWGPGDTIVITPTSYSPWEAEIFKIQSISADNTTLSLNGSIQHTHLGTTETIQETGQILTIAAEVGLLSRNIKIIGDEYPDLLKQAFGARVLVGQYIQNDVTYTGYARLNNVEFYLTGQEGWVDYYDPRYSLAFLDLGPITARNPSYVKKCAFHHGFSPAIGVFNTDHLDIEDNVIYHTVGSAIISYSLDTRLRRNLVTLVLWPGSFNNRRDKKATWDSGFEINQATMPVLQDNIVAGSERSGFHIDGQSCGVGEGQNCGAEECWSGNIARSLLVGIQSLPGDGITTCTKVTGFTVMKAHDFGIFLEISTTSDIETVEVSGIVSADNTVGLFPFVYAPSASRHLRADKIIRISNSTFIGTTDAFDCVKDPTNLNQSTFNFQSSSNSRSWTVHGSGKTGVTMGTFSSGKNNAPGKPWKNIMAYHAIGGLTQISDVTFAKFRRTCGSQDVCLTTPPSNDDAIHPIRMHNIKLVDVDTESKVFFHRPNLGKVNPSDCVDMDCDGLKKVIVEDMDGTFLGRVGSIISQSEFEWDVNAKRGLGDYRIPKVMLTALNGSRIDVKDIAPNKGIIRDDTCSYKTTYQAWECHGYDYEMLMLESMDPDTETRRVSPVAVLGGGYLDLVNGPQDHGWCLGYTCQKRLSTFPIVLAMGKHFDVFFTGTTPQNLRLHLLNTNNTQAVVLAIWYASPYRLDVYFGRKYIPPKNAYNDTNGQQLLRPPSFTGQYVPDIISDQTGANYVDRDTQMLHILVKGNEPVDIKTSALLVIDFNVPAMTVDQFFGEKIVQNLAIFLDIPLSKIRIASSVRESRRRRRADTVAVSVEIGNGANEDPQSDGDFLTYDVLQKSTATLTSAIQLNSLSDVLDVPVSDVSLIEPMPAPEDPAWQSVTESLDNGESYIIVVQVPSQMSLVDRLVPQSEGSLFSESPVIQTVDQQGNLVKQLGSKVDPWKITAELIMVAGSDIHANLEGNSTVEFRNGIANFTHLRISHSGSYKLLFNVTYPEEAAGQFTVISEEFEVLGREITGNITAQPIAVTTDEQFTIGAHLVDALTGELVEDISWKGHTWTCEASVYMPEISASVILSGSLSMPVDPLVSGCQFADLALNMPGRYFVALRFISSPPYLDVSVVSKAIDVVPKNYRPPTEEQKRRVTIRFENDYDVAVAGKEDYFAAMVYNTLQPDCNATLKNFTVSKGSILVSFDVAGSEEEVHQSIELLTEAVTTLSFTFDGLTLSADGYLLVDEEKFGNGRQLAKSGLSMGVIVAISVVCAFTAIIVMIIIGLLVKANKAKKFKVGNSPSNSVLRPRRSVYDTKNSYLAPMEDSEEMIIPKAPPISVLYAAFTPTPSPSPRQTSGQKLSPPLTSLTSPRLSVLSVLQDPANLAPIPVHLSVGNQLANSPATGIRGKISPRVSPIAKK